MLHTIAFCGTESCQSKETSKICLPSYQSFQSARVMPHDVITPETRRQCYYYSLVLQKADESV